MQKRIWLTWEIQRRNRTLSSKLNADLYEITASGSRWKRYPVLILRTVYILFKTRPTLIFSQNPSLLLSAIAVIYGKVRKINVIIDAHNAGIFPLEGKSNLLNRIAKTVNSHADKVIVSNAALKEFINKNRPDVFAIPDPIPSISSHAKFPLTQDKFNLVFVCSWATDEPYKEVLLLAENLSDIAHIYITGNSRNKEKSISGSLPVNIALTGFLSDESYEDLLVACDGIMVLTTRDNCLVCGAYEGVAVEKPMILSNTKALIQFFDKGCIYTDHSALDIENSIRALMQNQGSLTADVKSLKQTLEINMDSILQEFNQQVSDFQ